MIRAFFAALALVALASCSPKNLNEPPPDLGDFALGHNIVVASKMQKGPVSRDATEDEWVNALKSAVDDRFGRYDGDNLYHFGISVEGYMLAPKGVPLVYTPKSALIINVTVWDDARNRKLNSKPFQLTAFEDTNEDSLVIGSGWGRTKQQQLDGLSYNAIYTIEKWLLENHQNYQWFVPGGSPSEPPEQEGPVVTGGQ